MSQQIYFAVLEEIYNNVGQQFLSLAIIQLHALSLFEKRLKLKINSFCNEPCYQGSSGLVGGGGGVYVNHNPPTH